jgi:hypothetical protein
VDSSDWAALSVAVITIIGSFVGSVRWLVKHYLIELRENSGSSIKDQVTRLEARVEILYEMMLQRDK